MDRISFVFLTVCLAAKRGCKTLSVNQSCTGFHLSIKKRFYIAINSIIVCNIVSFIAPQGSNVLLGILNVKLLLWYTDRLLRRRVCVKHLRSTFPLCGRVFASLLKLMYSWPKNVCSRNTAEVKSPDSVSYFSIFPCAAIFRSQGCIFLSWKRHVWRSERLFMYSLFCFFSSSATFLLTYYFLQMVVLSADLKVPAC